MHKDINVNVSGPMQPTSIYKTVVLKGQAPFAAQVTEPNTKYVIKHNFDLSGGAIVYDGWEIEGMGGNPSIIDGEEYWLTDYESGIAEPTTYTLVDDECFFVIDNHISEVKELTLQYEESAWIATKRRGYHARILSHLDSNAAIIIPEGCLLEFDGGAISNGTLVGQSTILIYNQPLNDILTATLEGTWRHESGVKADEEDITDLNGELKFKDKAYVPADYSGLGRKYLRKNLVNGVNTLTQSMMQATNTIYIIQYDFTLGENITVPANCVLWFDGGSINGSHTLDYNGAVLKGSIKVGCTCIGAVGNSFATPEMYGAKGDRVTNDTDAIQNCINGNSSIKFIYNRTYLLAGDYKTLDSNKHYISLHSNLFIDFCGSTVIRESKETLVSGLSMIYLGQCSNVQIKGGTIVGDLAAHTDLPMNVEYWNHGFAIRGSNNIVIDNVNIQYHMGDGITCMYGAASYNVTVINCNIKECQRHGVSFTRGGNYLVKNCDFDKIYWIDCVDFEKHIEDEILTNVTVDNIRASSGGLECIGVDGFTLANSLVQDVHINNNPSLGIEKIPQIINSRIANRIRVFDKAEILNSVFDTIRTIDTGGRILISNSKFKNILTFSTTGILPENVTCFLDVNNCSIEIDNWNIGTGTINKAQFNNCSFTINSRIDLSRIYNIAFNNCVFYSYIDSMDLAGYNKTKLENCTLHVNYLGESIDYAVRVAGKVKAEMYNNMFDFSGISSTMTVACPIIARSPIVVFNNNEVISDSALGTASKVLRCNYTSGTVNNLVYCFNNIAKEYSGMVEVATATVKSLNNILSGSF